MKLFSEEKSRSHKVVNAVLLFWILGALTFTITSFVEFKFFEDRNRMPHREITLAEYTRRYCFIFVEEPTLEACEEYWLAEKEDLEYNYNWHWYDPDPLLPTITSGISLVVASVAIVGINFPKIKNKKKE